MTWKPKESYETEEEREAWQKGYDIFDVDRGPKGQLHEFLENTVKGGNFVRLHPLARDMLGELFEDMPDHLRDPLLSGFGNAFLDTVLRRR